MASCPSSTAPFMIQSNASPYCVLDVADHSKEEGGKVVLWSKNGGTNQQWTYTDGFLTNVGSGLVLQVNLGSSDRMSAGMTLSQGKKASASDSYHQRWVINTDHGYIMPWDPRVARLALAGSGNRTAAGTDAAVEALTDFPNTIPQQWVTVNAPASSS